MVVVDKLLCNFILNNIRLASNMIAAMNLVATLVGSIICSILLVGHAAALGALGQNAEELVQGATQGAAGAISTLDEAISSLNGERGTFNVEGNGELDGLSLIVTSILLGVCLGYIIVSIMLIVAVKKEKAGLLIPWMIFTVFAIFFFAGIGLVELILAKTLTNYFTGGCSLFCIPIALFQLMVVLALRKELTVLQMI